MRMSIKHGLVLVAAVVVSTAACSYQPPERTSPPPPSDTSTPPEDTGESACRGDDCADAGESECGPSGCADAGEPGCGGNDCADTRDNPNDGGLDLSGRWIAKGYRCDNDRHVEVVDIDHDNRSLIASKVVGDGCVRGGEATFQSDEAGSLEAGDTFRVRVATTGNPVRGALRVDSRDRLTLSIDNSSTDIPFVRADTSDRDSANLAGGWLVENYGCQGRYLNGRMTIRNRSSLIGTITGGQLCLEKWEGKRQGREFGVTVTLRGSSTSSSPGWVEVVAREFLVLRPDERDWQLRMWRAGLFQE